MGRLWDPIAGRPRDQIMGRSRDFPRTLVKQVTQDFKVSGSSKKVSKLSSG